MVIKTEDVGKAHPRIVEAVETMIKKGKWTVPGTFGLRLWGLDLISYPQAIKRSLATSTSCNYWKSVEIQILEPFHSYNSVSRISPSLRALLLSRG
jgi:hypothetical protein